MVTSSDAFELIHECARRVTIIYLRDITRVQLFYFDSNTIWKAYVDMTLFG